MRQADKQTGRQTERKQREILKGRGGVVGREADRQRGRQRDREADREKITKRETEKQGPCHRCRKHRKE